MKHIAILAGAILFSSSVGALAQEDVGKNECVVACAV